MKLHTLRPAKGSTRTKKRIGRGQGSGRGGTSTRGHNGAKSRSGYSKKIGFEGGQMPLQRRVPKFGFKNNNKIVYKPINLLAVQELCDKINEKVITLNHFVQNGLAGKNDRVKILGTGDIKIKVEVQAHAFSKTASQAIEKKGGKCVLKEGIESKK